MLAVALLSFGCMNVMADEVGQAVVKMTYVNGSDDAVDTSYGEIPEGEPAYCGYNKISNGEVALANKGWGVNNIAYLQVDASAFDGVFTKVTLTGDFQQIAARGMNYGVGYNSSVWSSEMTWNTADRTITTLGATQGVNKATDDIELSFEITDAFKTGNVVTILVYNLAAGAGYIKNPKVEVEYVPNVKETKIIDFEDDDISMFSLSASDRISSAVEANANNGTKVANFTCTNANAVALAAYNHKDLTQQASKVEYSFDFVFNEVAGQNYITIGDADVHTCTVEGTTLVSNPGGFTVKNNWGYGNNGAIFNLGVNRGKLDGSSNENFFAINGEAKAGSTLELKAADIWGVWLHADVVVDVEAKTVSYVITKEGEELFAEDGIAWINESATKCTQFDVYFANKGTAYVDNIKITSTKSSVNFWDYTIRYVDAEGNELKAPRIANGKEGDTPLLLESDKAAFENEDGSKKYIYDSDDAQNLTIAEGTVVTVVFKEAAKYYAVLNCKAGSETLKQFRDFDKYWFWEGDTYVLYPSRAYKGSDGSYYYTEANAGYNCAKFNFPGAAVKTGQYYIGTLNYTKNFTEKQKQTQVDPETGDEVEVEVDVEVEVAYYAECEDLALPVEDEGNGTGLGQLVGTVNSWYSFSGGYFERFSGARGIRLDPDSYFYTEPIAESATYKVTFYGRNDISANCPKPYVLGLRDASGDVKLFTELNIPDWGSATTGTNVVEGVAIPAGSSLVVYNDGSVIEEGNKAKQISLDDVTLVKTGEYVEPVTVGIQNVEKAQQNGIIYNLAGQAVKAVQKGLYIKNGKKYIVK